MKNIILQAHRGASAEYPENTMPAFIAAIQQGYGVIELDPGVTRDGRIVLLHDDTINRTGRNKDGSVIAKQVKIRDITYPQALEYDFGICFSNKFSGTKLPLLSEVLELAEKSKVLIKIDNKFQRFEADAKQQLFHDVNASKAKVAFTCNNVETIELVKRNSPKAHIHYDGPAEEPLLKEVAKISNDKNTVVWLPYQCAATSWVKIPFADEALCRTVKKYAKLGLWILSQKEEMEEAIRFGADFIETTGISPILCKPKI